MSPPDAMHFHSGMGCSAVQSELRPEVSLFISSAQKPKNSRRGRERAAENKLSSQGTYTFFEVADGGGGGGWGGL